MYICKECKNVYVAKSLRDKKVCPIGNCFGDLVEIDDALAPIIQMMWQKDIHTKFCCSGHPASFNSSGNCYIIFDLAKSGCKIHETIKNMKHLFVHYPRVELEYMPVLNKYTVSLPYNDMMEWSKAIEFFGYLALSIDSSDNPYDVEAYFHMAYRHISSDFDRNPVSMKIGVLLSAGDDGERSVFDDDYYWSIEPHWARSMNISYDKDGNALPPDSFEHSWDPDYNSFSRLGDPFPGIGVLKRFLGVDQ